MRVLSQPAPARDRASGLLAFLTVELDDGLVLDGITLRRTRDGRTTLSFPVRVDRRGGRHPVIRPIDEEARLAFEARVLEALAS